LMLFHLTVDRMPAKLNYFKYLQMNDYGQKALSIHARFILYTRGNAYEAGWVDDMRVEHAYVIKKAPRYFARSCDSVVSGTSRKGYKSHIRA
jgi:hypothetical protein